MKAQILNTNFYLKVYKDKMIKNMIIHYIKIKTSI